MNPPAGYRREAPGVHPPYDHPAYASTHKRAPQHAPIRLEHTLSEITGPRFAREIFASDNGENDLTHFNGGAALGERIVVTGRVLDEDGRAIPAYCDRNLAGECRRPLCSRRGPTPGSARSAFRRHRQGRHRRARRCIAS